MKLCVDALRNPGLAWIGICLATTLLFACHNNQNANAIKPALVAADSSQPAAYYQKMSTLPYVQADSAYRTLCVALLQTNRLALLQQHLNYYNRFCHNAKQWHALNYFYKGTIKAYASETDSAVLLLHPALNELAACGLNREYLMAAELCADLYSDKGFFDSAVTLRCNTLNRLSHDSTQHKQLYKSIGKLGIDMYHIGDFTRSIQLIDSALTYFSKAKDTTNVAFFESAKSVLLYKNRDYAASLKCAEHSLILRLINNDTLGAAESYNNIALSYAAQSDWPTAKSYFRQAIAYFTKMNSPARIPIMLHNIANCCLTEKKPDSAIVYANQAYLLAKQRNQFDDMRNALRVLSKAYVQKNDWKNAYQCRSRLSAIRDSLFTIEKQKIITEQIVKHEALQKQQQILTLQKDKQLEQQKQKNLFVLLLSVVLLGALITAFLVYKNIKNKELLRSQQRIHAYELERLNTEVERNKQELTNYTNLLIAKSGVIQQMETEIKNLSTEKDETKTLEAISSLRLHKIITEQDWLLFKEHFDRVYPGFMPKIKNTYPTLSAAELRMFLLIWLKVDSNEAASMLGISTDSTKKARYRLKKKLGLTEAEDLQEFIQKMTTRNESPEATANS